jgi:ATP-dependent DNA ligase
MLALAVTKLPRRTGLGVQLKFDGYRALGIEANGKVPLLSHNGKWSTRRIASRAWTDRKNSIINVSR